MRFEISASDNFTTLKLLDGKLDTRNAAELKSQFVILNTEGKRQVILNMEEVKYVDSSGLSALLTGNRIFKAADGVMVLCEINAHVEKLIGISKLDQVLNILPTEDEAREAIFMYMLEHEIGDQLADENEAGLLS